MRYKVSPETVRLFYLRTLLKKPKKTPEVGMETLTNYMEAQAQWQKAWSDWIEAKAELRVNETYYLKSTGRLSD